MDWDEYNRISQEINEDPFFESTKDLVSNRSFFIDNDTRAKISAAAKEAKNRPEVKAKISAAAKAANARPEVKAKISAAAKEVWASPEVRAAKSAAMKDVCARPEVKAKISAAQKEAMNRPEVREHLSNKQKELHSDPKYAEAIANANKQRSSGKSNKQRSIKICTPAGIFNTRTDAAKHYGVYPTTILNWIKNDPDNFYQIKDNK